MDEKDASCARPPVEEPAEKDSQPAALFHSKALPKPHDRVRARKVRTRFTPKALLAVCRRRATGLVFGTKQCTNARDFMYEPSPSVTPQTSCATSKKTSADNSGKATPAPESRDEVCAAPSPTVRPLPAALGKYFEDNTVRSFKPLFQVKVDELHAWEEHADGTNTGGLLSSLPPLPDDSASHEEMKCAPKSPHDSELSTRAPTTATSTALNSTAGSRMTSGFATPAMRPEPQGKAAVAWDLADRKEHSGSMTSFKSLKSRGSSGAWSLPGGNNHDDDSDDSDDDSDDSGEDERTTKARFVVADFVKKHSVSVDYVKLRAAMAQHGLSNVMQLADYMEAFDQFDKGKGYMTWLDVQKFMMQFMQRNIPDEEVQSLVVQVTKREGVPMDFFHFLQFATNTNNKFLAREEKISLYL